MHKSRTFINMINKHLTETYKWNVLDERNVNNYLLWNIIRLFIWFVELLALPAYYVERVYANVRKQAFQTRVKQVSKYITTTTTTTTTTITAHV